MRACADGRVGWGWLSTDEGRTAGINTFVNVVGQFTSLVFTSECVLKIISEGYSPSRFFTDEVRAPTFLIILRG